jgi:hypothetical protein
MYATLESVINNIKSYTSLPSSQVRFTTEYFTNLISFVIDTKVYPLLQTVDKQYNVAQVSVVSDVDGLIEIPSSAYNASIVSIIDMETNIKLDNNNIDLTNNSFQFFNNSIKVLKKSHTYTLTYLESQRALVPSLTTSKITIVAPSGTNQQVEVDLTTTLTKFDIISSTGKVLDTNVSKVSGTNKVFVIATTKATLGSYLVPVSSTLYLTYPNSVIKYIEQCVATEVFNEIADTEQMSISSQRESVLYSTLVKSLSQRYNSSEVIKFKRRF